MPLMGFSEPGHIDLLLSGEKTQTTRPPRKIPLKVGDTLFCYYKPRHKRDCDNCLNYSMEDDGCVRKVFCSYWNNFFGKASIIGILHCNNVLSISNKLSYESQILGRDFERYISGFDIQNQSFMESWANADGFVGLQEADMWFTSKYKNKMWKSLSWDIILFDPEWINNRARSFKMCAHIQSRL